MKGEYVPKNFGAVGAMAPTPLSLKTPRGGGGGLGAGGCRIQGPGLPPPPELPNGYWSRVIEQPVVEREPFA